MVDLAVADKLLFTIGVAVIVIGGAVLYLLDRIGNLLGEILTWLEDH